MNNTVSMRRINVVIQEELCAAFSVSNTSYVESCVIAPQIPDPQLCASAAVARFKQEEMNPNVIIQAFDKATNRTNPLRKAMIISTRLYIKMVSYCFRSLLLYTTPLRFVSVLTWVVLK